MITVVGRCRWRWLVATPLEQVAVLQIGTAPSTVAVDRLLFCLAMIAANHDYGAAAAQWQSSGSHDAALYRRIVDMQLPFLKRTQVRREYASETVRGACFGISRSDTRQLSCKLSLHNGQDAHVESGLQMISVSVAAVDPA